MASERPDVLYMDCHDLGDWIGCYDQPYVGTAALDRLAAQGVRFTQFFATAPICMPSRSSIQTGLMPHQVGVVGQEPIGEGHGCLAGWFRDAGYETVLSGSSHLLNSPARLGFERHLTDDGRQPERDAAKFLEARTGERRRPFFLHVSFFRVHRPFGAEYDPAVAARVTVPPYLPDLAVTRADLATLTRQVELLDTQVGHVLHTLDASRLSENTLVVFSTDHGMAVAHAKHTLRDSGLRCALLMRLPPVIPAGLRADQLLSNTDLTATLLELCGIQTSGGVPGRSFAAACRGEEFTGRAEVFAEHSWGRRSGKWYYSPQRSVRTPRYRYVRSWTRYPLYLDNGWLARFANNLQLVEPYFAQPTPEESLFDLTTDPFELTNLAGSPDHSGVVHRLSARLAAFLKETSDPVVTGFVPNQDGHPDVPQWQLLEDGSFHIEPEDPLDPREVRFGVPETKRG